MVYLIIPCYNEEEVLPDTNRKLLDLLPELPDTVHICYVDDGSSDSTWALIRQFSVISPVVRGIRSSHNCFHGGEGSNSCSISAGLTILGQGVTTGCQVSCYEGYYACCSVQCTCVKI